MGPVSVDSSNMVDVQSRVKICAFQRSKNSADTWLGCHARHAVRSSIDSISAGIGAGYHRGNTSPSRVVSVDMDR